MFPPEVFLLIFEFLYEQRSAMSTSPILGACALACRQFRGPAQALMFRSILVTNYPDVSGSSAAAELADTLSNPALARSVRHLSLVIDPCIDTGRSPWPVVVTVLDHIAKWSKVEEFSVYFNGDHRDSWSDIPAPLRAVLEKIMLSPLLHTLALSKGPFPLHHILPRLKRVRYLSLRDIFGDQDEESDVSLAPEGSLVPEVDEPLRLRELTIQPYMGPKLGRLRRSSGAPLIAWSDIQSLSISQPYGLETLFAPAGSVAHSISDTLAMTENLTTYSCDIPLDSFNIFSKLQPRTCDSLQHIKIQMSTTPPEDEDPYMGLTHVLADFPPHNKLQSLNLSIDVDICSVSDWSVDEQQWGKLAKTLTPSAFPCLKNVGMTVDLSVNRGDEARIQSLNSDLRKVLVGGLGGCTHFEFNLDVRV